MANNQACAVQLRKFAYFLSHAQVAMNSICYLNILDDPDENRRMVRKLPRWAREVDITLIQQTVRAGMDASTLLSRTSADS
jgi:hypothetical protein